MSLTPDLSEYWSSSEYNNYTAYFLPFLNGGWGDEDKQAAVRVRAVRAFWLFNIYQFKDSSIFGEFFYFTTP